MIRIVCNTRNLANPLTGVPRYTSNLLSHMIGEVATIAPTHMSFGMPGHMWEQIALPFKLRGRLLWSPSQSGPLIVPHQVVTIHDAVALDHPEWVGGTYGKWYRFLLPRLLRNVAHIIVVSNFTRSRLLAHFPDLYDRVTVIANGVDARFQRSRPNEVADVIRELRLPPRYLVSLSSIAPRKNIGRLLDAWRAANTRLSKDVWLVLVGGKGEKRVYGELDVGELPDRVLLTGHLPDKYLAPVLSGAIAFIYISLYEGFGLPVLEAMACGTPCLVSDCDAIAEVVSDAALKVDPTAIGTIEEGLCRIVNDTELALSLRDRGNLRAREFSWGKAADLTLEVLRTAAIAPAGR